MSKMKKLIFSILFFLFLVPSLPVRAEIESTHEIELKSLGHGIVIPTSFEVKSADGTFATLSGINPKDWQLEEIGEEHNYSIDLGNGYVAKKWWLYSMDSWGKGYMQTSVYNENDELVFHLGRNEQGEISCIMKDEEGNLVQDIFPQNDYEPIDYGDEWINQDLNYDYGDSIPPCKRNVYDAESDTMRVYHKSGNGDDMVMNLREKYEYNHGGDPVCTVYHLRATGDDYTKDEECYEAYSFKKSDMAYVGFWGPILTPYGEEYSYNFSEIPLVVSVEGEEYYFYKVASRNIEWSTQQERDLCDGKIVESVAYFTKEQIEILERENLRFYDEIEEKYPEFLLPRGEPEIVGSPDEKGEGQIEEEKAIDAIKQTNNDEKTDTDGYITGAVEDGNGNKSYIQELTGDVVDINGAYPTKLMTQVDNTPVGIQYKLILMDDSGATLATFGCFDIEHTNYKYAYLTMIDVSTDYPTFMVAGSDAPVSGNLGYMGQVTTDTENGQETGAIYVQPGGNP